MDSMTRNNVFSVEPLIRLLKEVIQEEESREILQADLIHLLPYFTIFLEDQLPEAVPETLKVWLQLLHNCLTQAKSILYRPNSRQRCLDCLSNNPKRASEQIENWRVHFNYLFHGLESDFSVIVRGREAVIAPVIAPILPLMKDVIEEKENREILETELRPVHNLLLDISVVFQDQQKVAPERLKIWLQLLRKSLTEAKTILHTYGPSQRQRHGRRLDCLIGNRGRSTEQHKKWKVPFNFLFQGLQQDFSMFVTSASHQIIKGDPIQQELESAQESREGQPLSNDEAWELFRRVAFRDSPSVPMDIEECATNIADECKGFRLAITLVAAAMRGKSRVDEWETSLSSIKNAGSSSSADTLNPRIEPQPYPLLRWCYDALPNSNIKNCFLYCAMYAKDEEIEAQELVQMWVAEGLVRSKQGNHLMDMAIGQSYVNLLVDRCFFQNATSDQRNMNAWVNPEHQWIGVHHAVREMAIYVGEKEENCLLKACQRLQFFPTIHNNEDCKRISLHKNDIKNLPTELPCPKLVTLMLSNNPIEELPPGFLATLTSLKVLHLRSKYTGSIIKSIPSSVGQLEFLSLRGLNIRDLPEDIYHLSSLQFLDLSYCERLQSLPSKIGELKNLKNLSLKDCRGLKVIPHEISQLTSLTTLDADEVYFSVEAESEARSIWRLKGLRNLTMLRIFIGRTTSSSRISEGIMGTWLEMRHLYLSFVNDDDDDVMVELPQDMKKMSKLQLFTMARYIGSSLPAYICKFQHLECIFLGWCSHLRELSPLELVPSLKALYLYHCGGLKELGIGNTGGFSLLEILVLSGLQKLESIGGASNNGVWNESTLPRLRLLSIRACRKVNRLPAGMDKLPNLVTILGEKDWWQQIDGDMKIRLHKFYKERAM